MNINKNNYEEIFIDYYDGNLSAEKVAELFLFLESHPDLKSEFESFSAISLESSALEFPYKDQLKKEEINSTNFSQYMIAAVEGDLNAGEIKLLEDYLKIHPAHERDYRLFQAAKLVPSDEVFPHKRELKRAVPMVFNFSNTMKYAIAAILLLAFIGGTYFTFTSSNERTTNEFADLPENSINNVDSNDNTSTTNINTEFALEKNTSSDQDKENSDIQSPQLANNVDNANVNNKESDINQNNKSEVKIPSAHTETTSVASVDGIQIKEIQTQTPEQHLRMNSPVAQTMSSTEPVQEEYMTVWEALRQASDRKLHKATLPEGEALASADENINPRASVKNLIEKSIEKVSNDKVAITNENDPASSTTRFSLALGNFKIEKEKVR